MTRQSLAFCDTSLKNEVSLLSSEVPDLHQTPPKKMPLPPRLTLLQEEFVEMYRLYLTSHFDPAFELLLALVVYGVFATSGYFLETFSVYLLVIGLLWTPLLFNPNGLDFTYARSGLPSLELQ